MAVTAANLTTGNSATDDTSYATASVSPSANQLVLVSVTALAVTTATTPTLSGAGMTWVAIDNQAQGLYKTTLFRSLNASPGSGALTIDFGSDTQDLVAWSVDEFDNVDTSGANGAGAIVQSAKNTSASGTSLTVTLAAFGSSTNATYGAFADGVSTSSTAGSGFAKLGDTGVGALRHTSEWRNDNDTSVDMSWADTGELTGIAVEIKNAVAEAKAADYSFFM